MFDMKKSYGYNKKMAEEGVKMVVGDPKEDFFLVRRLPSDEYQREASKVYRANAKMLDHLKLQNPEEFSRFDKKLRCEILAKTCLVGWGAGIKNDGKAVPYSEKLAAEMLYQYDDFHQEVLSFANNNENYPLTDAVLDVATVKEK